MMDEQELQVLLSRFRDTRDPDALSSFFDATAPRLFGLARHLSSNVSDAEDLLQSTYLAVIESIDRYDPERSAVGWATGIMSLQARYQRRRGSRVPSPDRLDKDVGIEPDAEAAFEETGAALRAAVARLPDLYRDAVDLVVSQGMGPSEIATRLGRSAGTVRVQLPPWLTRCCARRSRRASLCPAHSSRRPGVAWRRSGGRSSPAPPPRRSSRRLEPPEASPCSP